MQCLRKLLLIVYTFLLLPKLYSLSWTKLYNRRKTYQELIEKFKELKNDYAEINP